MFVRALATSLILLFGAQASAAGQSAMICRYSGKVLEDCPCPAPQARPVLSKQLCCELRQTAPFTVSAVIREQHQLPSSCDAALPAWSWRALAHGGMALACALREQSPPPDGRDRYLILKTLLN